MICECASTILGVEYLGYFVRSIGPTIAKKHSVHLMRSSISHMNCFHCASVPLLIRSDAHPVRCFFFGGKSFSTMAAIFCFAYLLSAHAVYLLNDEIYY